MAKNLFVRIPRQTFNELIAFCSAETIRAGRRVTLCQVVHSALEAHLARRTGQQVSRSSRSSARRRGRVSRQVDRN